MDDGFITLGIETSCDDTAIAVLRGAGDVVCDALSSQIRDHSPFGGVLPELASRKHQEAIIPLLRSVMAEARATPRDIDLIAVTAGPGLMGSLIVGVMAAKALSQGWGVPIIGVNHLEGHLYAGMVAHPELSPPFLCLIVSGGHTEIVTAREGRNYTLLGDTRDDAAGEAYDKAAKLMGLGYPGGPEIELMARDGDSSSYSFPIGMKGTKTVEFSFSGVKTSLRAMIDNLKKSGSDIPTPDICASFQKAITEALLAKVKLAVSQTGIKRVAISGGVAANAALRDELSELGHANGWEVYLPPKKYCTDNAIMIAAAGYAAYSLGERSDMSLSPDPSWSIWKN
ncbi:MAG: tRNA (adenosine(37)-N6)-threonylcarbamoyltransferase complex transferase subunit TsaD [Synergistaceae bacterium]|jgi:N6-L-threonylcarbamoyladenine synthase|nr:tRNA (adenosine(37)-N6)-threonylcarbamoyltransferase complex transferase subunit TsaD [Synergistaceae bacterium]